MHNIRPNQLLFSHTEVSTNKIEYAARVSSAAPLNVSPNLSLLSLAIDSSTGPNL